MEDTELYQQILGIESPWSVSNVDLSEKKGAGANGTAEPLGQQMVAYRFY